MTTLNTILDALKAEATAHRQLRSFFFGFGNEVEERSGHEYPVLWASLVGGSGYRTNEGVLVLQLAFLDTVPTEAPDKRQEVYSDMFTVMGDILAVMGSPTYEADFLVNVGQVTATESPFDFSGDKLYGWMVPVEFAFTYTMNHCAVPKA